MFLLVKSSDRSGIIADRSNSIGGDVLRQQTDKFKRIAFQGQAISAFKTLNSVALFDIENLRTLDKLGRRKEESADSRRRRWSPSSGLKHCK